MFVNRIGNRLLSTLCDRIGVAFEVGYDPHKIFKREAESSRRGYSSRMEDIAKRVELGGTLADAVRAQGNYFPENFVQMVEVGERTGRLETVLSRMSAYYEDMANLRKEFINAITWPIIQLLLAIVVVGLMIYVPAVVAPQAGEAADMLGFGLLGAEGLRTYLFWVLVAFGVLVALYVAARNGVFNFLSGVFYRIPFVSRIVTVFPEARFVQTLSLALEAGIDSWHAVDLSFRSAASPIFAAKAEQAKTAVRQGRPLVAVIQETGLFTNDTIEAVRLGEDTGRLPETLDKHFKYLKIQVQSTMTKLTYIASSLIWVLIASVLILIIFRVFSNYLANIEDAGTNILMRPMPADAPTGNR